MVAWTTKQSQIGILILETEITSSLKREKTVFQKILFSNSEQDLRKSQFTDEKRQSMKILPLLAAQHQDGLDIMSITAKGQLEIVSREGSQNIRNFCFHRQKRNTIFYLTNSAEVYQIDGRRNGGCDRRCILSSTSFMKNEPIEVVAGRQQLFIRCITQRKSQMILVFKIEDAQKSSGLSQPAAKLRIIDSASHIITYDSYEGTCCLMIMSMNNHIQLHIGSDSHTFRTFTRQLPQASLCQAVDLYKKTPQVLLVYQNKKQSISVANFQQGIHRKDSIEESELINQLKQPPTVVRQMTFGKQAQQTQKKPLLPVSQPPQKSEQLRKEREKLTNLRNDIMHFKSKLEGYKHYLRQRIKYGGPMPIKMKQVQAEQYITTDAQQLVNKCNQIILKTRNRNQIMRRILRQYKQSTNNILPFITDRCDLNDIVIRQLEEKIQTLLPERDNLIRRTLWKQEKSFIKQSYKRDYSFQSSYIGQPKKIKQTISL